MIVTRNTREEKKVMASNKQKHDEDDGEVFPPGLTTEEIRKSHLAIEMALLRVRHRHEKAGDAHKYTFGELLKEASKELDEDLDYRERTGKSRFTDLLDSK
jgi:hypothetical protein